jgi:hypothetical protein
MKFNLWAGWLAVGLTLGSGAANAAETAEILHVDVRDVARYAGSEHPEAQALIDAMKSSAEKFFPVGVTFSEIGVGLHQKIERRSDGRPAIAPSKILNNNVYGVEIESASAAADGSLDLQIIALYQASDSGYVFRRLDVRAAGNPMAIDLGSVRVAEEIPASQTHFTVHAGLAPRKVVVEDADHRIKKIYPIGVGSFDEGVTNTSHGNTILRTTLQQNASLTRGYAHFEYHVDPNKHEPDHFFGMPFMNIVSPKHSPSPQGFHIVQHAKEAPAPHGRDNPDYNYMVRGFDSHGCMRLREKDLYELYAILMSQDGTSMPVVVSNFMEETEDHPLPLRNDAYVRLQKPFARGKDGLTKVQTVHKAPPIEKLSHE